MLNWLKIHGFRTLLDTECYLDPLTILIGKNGAGKTSMLDSLQIVGSFARGGVDRAFGPPPWTLAWQRTKGSGRIDAVRFESEISIGEKRPKKYRYVLALSERENTPHVVEERLTRVSDSVTLASFDFTNPPPSGTILSPQKSGTFNSEIKDVAGVYKSFTCYELNPSSIEQGNDPEHSYVGRDGFGVAGFLAKLEEESPEKFQTLQDRIKFFRPETEAVEVWSAGRLFWGLRDKGQKHPFPAVHLSWGDRQLVGLLCVLYSSTPGSTIAIEEIDRGFHHSRYAEIIELLSEAAYDGLDGMKTFQIVATTHSPTFINKLSERLSEIRMVTRVPGGGTMIRKLEDVVEEKLGGVLDQSIGEVWEMGLLEEVLHTSL